MNRYAIVGKGFIYPRHVQAIQATGGEVVLTCDNDPAKDADFLSYDKMLASNMFRRVDTVVICTPNYLHADMARKAIATGRQVICEKPLTIDDNLDGLDDVNCVMQLRHHPGIVNVDSKNLFIEAKMFRDDTYWNGWKGDESKSGGVLFNLGIHYIDLLVHLLGRPIGILGCSVDKKSASGLVRFANGTGEFNIEIVSDKSLQKRVLNTESRTIELSSKDNLSQEGLHKKVYEDFLDGNGVLLKDVAYTIRLISDIKKWSQRSR